MATYWDRAFAAHRAGNLNDAKALYRRVLGATHHNLGVIERSEQKLAEAENNLRLAMTYDPSYVESRFSLANTLLCAGRLEEGWAYYEARRLLPRLNIPKAPDGVPEWRGEDLTGKRLLVSKEQGFGDQIMFSRYLPEIVASEVVYDCDEPLAGVFQSMGLSVLTDSAGGDPSGFDCWVACGSLPGVLGAGDKAPQPPPLPLPLGLRNRRGGGIGVVPTGSPANANDAHRSLRAGDAEGLLAIGRDLRPEATGARDFWSTAEIVAGLDLIVTVDTAIAHLAATMGKPTWILLPFTNVDWRWGVDRTDSPWYPSARLFRQRAAGDWEQVLSDVRRALAAFDGAEA